METNTWSSERAQDSLDFFDDSIIEKGETHNVIDKALLKAIHAYSIRWIFTRNNPVQQSDNAPALGESNTIRNLANELWKEAYHLIPSVMSRPTYRSILALHLFSITPKPRGEEADHSSDLCLDVALNHHSHLRTEWNIQQALSISSHWKQNHFHEPFLGTANGGEYIHFQDMMFWFGVVCDTKRTMSRCRSSILLPGLSGDEKVWVHVRQRLKDFNDIFQPVCHSIAPLLENTASIILQHASACKSMCWNSITVVQDTIFHQMIGIPLNVAVDRALKDFSYFQDVFSPLLNLCARDFMMMTDRNQISYCKSTCPFESCILSS